jgi:uncharacterized membrane protein YdbT with pleckstrin-like domain
MDPDRVTPLASKGGKMPERFEWSGTPSWWNYFGRNLAAALLAAGSFVALSSPLERKGLVAALLALAALALFLSACWSKFSNRFSVRDGIISATYGLLSIEIRQIDARDLKDLVVKQSLLGRILNYGTLEFSSAGRDAAEVVFYGIPDPQLVRRLVTELRRSER